MRLNLLLATNCCFSRPQFPTCRFNWSNHDARSPLSDREIDKLVARAQIGPVEPKITGQTI